MDTVCPPGPLFGNAKWRNNCSFYLDSKGLEENARKPPAIKRPSLINLGLKSRPHLVTVRSMITPPPLFCKSDKAITGGCDLNPTRSILPDSPAKCLWAMNETYTVHAHNHTFQKK